MISKTLRYGFLALLCLVMLSACGDSKQHVPADAPGFVKGKAVHPTIKIGKPYRVGWTKYYPKYDPNYDEEGIASWYGPNFHGKMTANGETYNQWAMTAAHPTLPMPSMVRVTDTDTGKSIVVRINDRGPFADGRIIDLSRAAAEALGTRGKGLANVRVEYLKEETERYIAKLQLKKPQEMQEVDYALAQQQLEQDQSAISAQAKPTPSEVEDQDRALAESPSLPPLPHAPEKPASTKVALASEVPDHFAYEDSKAHITTVDARGVVMEEIGYAEDAFSVLAEGDYGAFSAHAATPDSRAPPVHAPPDIPFSSGESPWQKPIASGTQRYFIHAAQFAVRANAEALANQVSGLAPTQIDAVGTPEKPLWRVRLGPAFNRGIAEEIRLKLKNYAITDAVIVKED